MYRKPEESNWEQHRSDHHWDQSLLRDWNIVVLLELAIVPGLKGNDNATPKEDTDDQPDIGKSSNSFVHTSIFCKYNRICLQKEVQNAVYKGSVNRDEEDDRFEKEELQREKKMLVNQVIEVDDLFFTGMVNGEVASLLPDIPRSLLEKGLHVRLLHE